MPFLLSVFSLSRGNCCRDPEPDFRISGVVGGFFAFPSRGNCYRDPEPAVRIGGVVGGFFLFPPGGTVTVTPNRLSASAGRLGVFAFPSRGMITVTLNQTSASAGRLGVFAAFPLQRDDYRDPEPDFRIGGAVGVFAVFAFGGYLLRGGITASPAFGRPWRRPFRPFCASAPPAGF